MDLGLSSSHLVGWRICRPTPANPVVVFSCRCETAMFMDMIRLIVYFWERNVTEKLVQVIRGVKIFQIDSCNHLSEAIEFEPNTQVTCNMKVDTDSGNRCSELLSLIPNNQPRYCLSK